GSVRELAGEPSAAPALAAGPSDAEAAAPSTAVSAESETVKVIVASADKTDIRETLFYRMADKRYSIVSMKKESLSLEDIFLKLTTNESLDSTAADDDPTPEAEEAVPHA
ncbi:ABC transporter ATP-binding protein, partial [Paenibacillus ehimensis]|nr:ABC transporter ATP-binding protein [Paenibacillus ehimensis]